MRKLLNILALAVLTAAVAASCSNSYELFCTKYRANFRCDPTVPPFNVTTSLGSFVSVRCPAEELIVTDSEGHVTRWPVTEIEKRNFAMGLSGFIIGTPTLDNDRCAVYAYDLACPICDKASVRLKFNSLGVATCPDCGSTFNLNNNGIVISSESEHQRPLYRYPVSQTLQSLIVTN